MQCAAVVGRAHGALLLAYGDVVVAPGFCARDLGARETTSTRGSFLRRAHGALLLAYGDVVAAPGFCAGVGARHARDRAAR